jgi:hypothetical protein
LAYDDAHDDDPHETATSQSIIRAGLVVMVGAERFRFF